MFWIFTALAALAFTFFKLGTVSILVRLLESGLTIAMLVIAGLVVALLWKKYMASKPR
jgi:hypothetical protein